MEESMDIKDNLTFDEWYALFAQKVHEFNSLLVVEKVRIKWMYDCQWTYELAAKDYCGMLIGMVRLSSYDVWFSLFVEEMKKMGYDGYFIKNDFRDYWEDNWTVERAAKSYWEELKKDDDGYLEEYGISSDVVFKKEKEVLKKNLYREQLLLNKQLDFALAKAHNEGILMGLKICKEEWAQGELSHESICKNEEHFKSVLGTVMKEYNEFMKSNK